MPKFLVNHPLKHNGEDVAVGEFVEMSAKDAKALVELDVLTPAAKSSAGNTSGAGDSTGTGEDTAK